MRTRCALALGSALLVTTGLVVACGDDSESSNDGRVIDITMTDDMAYSPDTISVSKGETVTFRFRNDGEAVHEAVIGDEAYQMEQEALMAGGGTDHGGMDGDNKVIVEPGDTGEMKYRFDESGTTIIGCHQPGHYEAGMKATVSVS